MNYPRSRVKSADGKMKRTAGEGGPWFLICSETICSELGAGPPDFASEMLAQVE
jgi:hypothetical protein